MSSAEFQIKMHDGPARLGLFNDTITPALVEHSKMKIAEHETAPYNIQRGLAEWCVNETLKLSASSDGDYAFVQGSRYVDLRVSCALGLEELGFSKLILANVDELLQRPRDLVEIVTAIREAIKPETMLCATFAHPAFIPVMVYMGFDIFSDAACDFYSAMDVLMSPTHTYPLDVYTLYDINSDELREYNMKTLDFVLREVRAHIKNGTLRNIVEERAASSPQNMSVLRILDREKQDFLQRFTQLY